MKVLKSLVAFFLLVVCLIASGKTDAYAEIVVYDLVLILLVLVV